MHRTAWRSVVIGVAALLAACGSAAGVRVSNIDISQNYDQQELGIFSGGARELRVEVVNNPFPEIPKVAFDEIVVGSMQGRALGYPVDFSLEPQVEYKPERRIRALMVFDPPPSLSSIGLCRRDDIETGTVSDATADPPRIRVLGAYCKGETTVTRATGTVPRGPDVAGTNLEGLIAQMTATMFPIRNRNREENSGCSPFVIVC